MIIEKIKNYKASRCENLSINTLKDINSGDWKKQVIKDKDRR